MVEPTQSKTRHSTLSFRVPAHLGRSRLWWAYLLCAGVALWLAANGLYALATNQGAVSPGFAVNRRLMTGLAHSEEARRAGVRIGDRIIAFNNEPVLDAARLMEKLNALGGDVSIEMTLDHPGGNIYHAALRTEWRTISLHNVTSKAKGVLFVLVGLLLFWFNPGRRESWAFLVACMTIGLEAVAPLNVVGAAQGAAALWMLAWIAGALIGPAWLYFFLEFPYPEPIVLRYGRAFWIGMAAPLVVLAALYPFYPWYPDYPLCEAYGVALLQAYQAIGPFTMLGCVGVLIWRYRRPHPPKQRAQLRALIACALILVLPITVWSLSTFGFLTVGDRWWYLVDLPFILFTAALALVMLRHDALEIDHAVVRTAAYTGALLLVGALYAGVVIGVPALVGSAVTRSPIALVLVTLVCGALLRPVKNLIADRLAERLDRDHVDLELRDKRALEARTAGRLDDGDRIGGFRVVRFLAAGGMGNVYLALREGAGGFRKELAIKLLLPDKARDPRAVRRFLDEARVAAGLSHANLVQVYDLGENEQGYFIAMEYVSGVDARTLVRGLKARSQELPLRVAAYVSCAVCQGLSSAHRATDPSGRPLGLVHRDVTPHNVLISTTGDVKLADFGVARLSENEEVAGRLVGKLAYMAPEQLAGAAVDARTDIFAAGIMLYQLVTGEHPFLQASEADTMRAIERGTYLPPMVLRPSCPAPLAAVIERAMAAAPPDRFQDASEMAERLQELFVPDLRTQRALAEIVVRLLGASQEAESAGDMPTAAGPQARRTEPRLVRED